MSTQPTLAASFLVEANLEKADLSQANLQGASLGRAILNRTNLKRANLREVNLRDASFRGANLQGANLENAICGTTDFADIDLSEVTGLETIIHFEPSTIGVDTLFKSKGKIPEAFLRGCGVPEDLITYLPSLMGQAIDYYSCFISHSSRDGKFCEQLAGKMRDKKLRVWYAPDDLKGGDKLLPQIDHAIKLHDKLIVVLSENSMSSEWVKLEISRAAKREREEGRRVLFPIRLVSFEELERWKCFDPDSGKDLAPDVREYFIPDFSHWKDYDSFEAGFQRLLADLRRSEQS